MNQVYSFFSEVFRHKISLFINSWDGATIEENKTQISMRHFFISLQNLKLLLCSPRNDSAAFGSSQQKCEKSEASSSASTDLESFLWRIVCRKKCKTIKGKDYATVSHKNYQLSREKTFHGS